MTRHTELFALLTAVLANATAAVTYSAVSVALVDIGRSLGVASVEEIWVPDSFLLAVVCVTPLTSYLIRRFGVDRLLAVGILGVMASSVAAAASSGLGAVVALLFVQGLFAAPIPPATQALVAVATPAARRSRAMALWSGGTMVGVLAGSALGGVIVDALGWRWIFALAVPVGLVALGSIALRPGRLAATLHGDRGSAGALHAPPTDVRGAALLIITLLSAGVALDVAGELEREALVAAAGLLGVAIAGSLVFAVHYRRVAAPILDLSTLADRNLATAATINLVVAGSSTGIFETVMLAGALGFAPEDVGLLNALRGVALLGGIGLGALAVRAGGAARGSAVGLVVLCAGKFGYTLWAPGTSLVQAAWPGIVSSIGFGMLGTATAVLAFATVDRARSAAAASVYVVSGVVGSAVGVALLDALRSWLAARSGTTSSYTEVFWLELSVTLVLLPLPWLKTGGQQRRAA